MPDHSRLALLLIAYRRVESVARILDISRASGVESVYIVIDKSPKKSLSYIQEEIVSLCEEYRSDFFAMQIIKRNKNVGCAASVMTGIDWIFGHETFACILEDDCIPTPDFFAFAKASREVMESNEDILLACGTQFAPKGLSVDPWVKSKYALTWGWATTRRNWTLIRSGILRTENFSISSREKWSLRHFLDSEERYWDSGARRARKGYVDVWDTILLHVMRKTGKYALLPTETLVLNVGDDATATHTKSSEWTNRSTGTFSYQSSQPKRSMVIDEWLKKNFFRISARHLVSTRITQIIDLLRAPIKPPLGDQFNDNQIKDL